MEKNPLRLTLKLGTSTPEPGSPTHPSIVNKMTEEETEQPFSDEEAEEEDWQEDAQGDDIGFDDDENVSSRQQTSQEDYARERHKKSKKKKKKRDREKEKERHKHRHHRERNENDEDEPPCKKQSTDPTPDVVPSRVSLAAFKELLEYLLQQLQKRDPQQFFNLPVTDAIAPGYSAIIAEPMHFLRIQQKIQEGGYTTLKAFQYDVRLICNNCMIYNQPDTIYYKAAKKLLHSIDKILAPDKIAMLKRECPSIGYISADQLGFDVRAEGTYLQEQEQSSPPEVSSNDAPKMIPTTTTTTTTTVITSSLSSGSQSDKETISESHQEDLSGEEVLEKNRKAAAEAAEKLTKKRAASTLGFLRQKGDGTTTLNFLVGSPCTPQSGNPKEKPVSLGLVTGKLNQGTSVLNNYREDKRSMAKPVKPLYYGGFSSFCPSMDSTFANLTKEESEMVYATYGNETAVQYAESICDFSSECDMAMQLVDQLLNLLTHKQHQRTKAVIEERKKLQAQETHIGALLWGDMDLSGNAKAPTAPPTNYNSLRSLSELGIDVSYLDDLEQMEKREQVVGAKLEENAMLLHKLSQEQKERLSKALPANLNNIQQPSPNEIRLAEKVTEGLISVARQVPPGAIAPVPIVRRAMGITMMPVADNAEQVEVDIESTSLDDTRTAITVNGAV